MELGKLGLQMGEENSNGDVTELYNSRKAELFSQNPATSAPGLPDKTGRRLV